MRAPEPAPEQPTARWAGIAARDSPRRGHVPSPVIRLVLVVDLLAAVLATGLVLAFGADRARPVAVPGVPTDLLLPAMTALVCLGELIHVRLRHGDAIEELALSEAAVVGTVFVLAPTQALLAAFLGCTLASTLRRRVWIKSLFNVGNYVIASTVLIATVRLVAGPETGFGVRGVVGLALGTLAFAAVNLVGLSRVLAVAGGVDPWQVVREQLRLSVFMAFGTAALGATTLNVALTAPTLLPFAALPAVALVYAYRKAAQESDERERTTHLIELSEVLAGRLDGAQVVTGFLAAAREAFGADVATIVLLAGTVLPVEDGPVTVELDGSGPHWRIPDARDLAWIHRVTFPPGAELLDGTLAPGAGRAGLLAPLEAEGAPMGAVALGTASRTGLRARDLSVFTPLASALAAALRGAQYQTRLHEQTSKLAVVVEQSSDGILVLDGNGVVQLWSPALTALVGVDEAAAVGRPLSRLVTAVGIDGEPVDAFQAARQQMSAVSTRVNVELRIIRPDGEPRWIRASHAAVFAGEALLRDVVIVHDMTAQRQVERLKADFIATVSHELRTPITPIKGYADLLLASKITHSGGPRHDIHLQTGDLAALTRRALEEFPDDVRRIRMQGPGRPVPVACDPLRVIQVVTNLVDNALKYSEPMTAVEVTVAVDSTGASITVADSGRGIPADQLERVFDRFHRVEDPMLMTTGGTGLGLFLARELVHGMGGALVATSTLGVGSVLRFTLPTLRPLGPLPDMTGQPTRVPVARSEPTGPVGSDRATGTRVGWPVISGIGPRGRTVGRVNRSTDPTPSVEVATNAPPIPWTSSRARNRPRPVPPVVISIGSSTRWNRSKTRSSWSAGIPRPLSATVIEAPVESTATVTSTAVIGSEYLSALSTRLVTTWITRSGSQATGTGRPGPCIRIRLTSSGNSSRARRVSAARSPVWRWMSCRGPPE